VDPTEVWATSCGAEGWYSQIMHFAPSETAARILFPNRTEAWFTNTSRPVGLLGNDSQWMHLDLAFWGTEGRAWYTQCEGWGYQTHGMAEPYVAPSSWDPDNVPAQREFTRALAAWIGDPPVEHECNLERSLRGFRLIMGMFKSSLTGQVWNWEDEVTDADLVALQQLMEAREGYSPPAGN